MVYVEYVGYYCTCGAWHCDDGGVAYSFECHYCIDDGMHFLLKEEGK